VTETKKVNTSVCGKKDKQIYICSDSDPAFQALAASRVTSKLDWECRQSLCALSSWNKVTLLWVPVTVGFRVMRMWMPWIGRDRAVLPLVPNQQFQSHHFGRLKVEEWLQERHSEHWAAAPGMRQSKFFVREGLRVNCLGTYWLWTGNNAGW
jgi:hypothetical protein